MAEEVVLSEGELIVGSSGQRISTGNLADVGAYVRSDAVLVNVKDHGAVGDGVTDDTAAINLAQGVAAATLGAAVYLPASANPYIFTGTIRCPHWKGDGRYASVLANSGNVAILQTSASFPLSYLRLEDIGFDGLANSGVTCISIFGEHMSGPVMIERPRFYRFSKALGLSGVVDWTVIDPIAEAPGNSVGQFASLDRGTRRGKFIRPKLRYLRQGIIAGTSDVSDITIDDLDVDFGWYTKVPTFSGLGGTVSYSATVLTDSGAAFTGITANQYAVAMPVLASGTSTSLSRNSLVDSGATFVSSSVTKGMIVQTGTRFGVVSAVESETTVWVEEWLDSTTRLKVLPPSVGTYTVSNVLVGLIASSTGTTVTVGAWRDFTGTSSTPASGTAYRILLAQPNYPIQTTTVCDSFKLIRPRIRRSYTDGISMQGTRHEIVGGHIKDGQDMGLTLDGTDHRVRGLLCEHNGTSGAWLQCSDSDIDLRGIDNGWTSTNIGRVGDAATIIGSRNRVTAKSRRVSSTQSQFAVVVNGSATGADNSVDVEGYNHLTAALGGALTPGNTYVRTVVGGVDYASLPVTAITWPTDSGIQSDLQTGRHETFSRDLINTASMSLGTGLLRLTYFTARRTFTAATMNVATGGTAVNGSQTLVRYGLYSVATNGDLTLIASTTNDTTTLLIAQNTEYPKAFTASTTVTQGKRYAVGVLQVGGGTPVIVGLNLAAAGGPATIYNRDPRLAGFVSAQADLGNVSSGSVTVGGNRFYAEVY